MAGILVVGAPDHAMGLIAKLAPSSSSLSAPFTSPVPELKTLQRLSRPLHLDNKYYTAELEVYILHEWPKATAGNFITNDAQYVG